MSHFDKVKEFLTELEYTIVSEDTAEELVIVEKADSGIQNLMIDAEDPILVIEYPLLKLNNSTDIIRIIKEKQGYCSWSICCNRRQHVNLQGYSSNRKFRHERIRRNS